MSNKTFFCVSGLLIMWMINVWPGPKLEQVEFEILNENGDVQTLSVPDTTITLAAFDYKA